MNTDEYNVLMSKIISGCRFKYISYDHKKALQEYNSNDGYILDRTLFPNPDCHFMPQNLKDKYSVERIGKLREIHFAPNGRAFRFKIGNKYAKSFGLDDFGVNVFILRGDAE